MIRRAPYFSLHGFIRERQPPKKGTRALVGILECREWGFLAHGVAKDVVSGLLGLRLSHSRTRQSRMV